MILQGANTLLNQNRFESVYSTKAVSSHARRFCLSTSTSSGSYPWKHFEKHAMAVMTWMIFKRPLFVNWFISNIKGMERQSKQSWTSDGAHAQVGWHINAKCKTWRSKFMPGKWKQASEETRKLILMCHLPDFKKPKQTNPPLPSLRILQMK